MIPFPHRCWGKRTMMGRRGQSQGQLVYEFRLDESGTGRSSGTEDRSPVGPVDLSWAYTELSSVVIDHHDFTDRGQEACAQKRIDNPPADKARPADYQHRVDAHSIIP